ncbi:MAG: GntR family transcriptional regulator [Planctomycetota bacterium]|nr:GntR family transcriptional regulator [Planctomycetota bacterium]
MSLKVERASLAEQVKEILINRIIEGKYKGGERLIELAVAKDLGVSQAPVREAFQQLVAMRILESEPHKGTRVREITDCEMGESTMVRGYLEEAAARHAVHALKDKLDDLRAEVQGMLDALEKGNFVAVAKHNVNFHRAIVHASGNQVLISVWESLAFEAKSRLCAQKAAYSVMLNGVKSCEPIIEAFSRGDGETAGRLLRLQTEKCGDVQKTATQRLTPADLHKALAAYKPAAT